MAHFALPQWTDNGQDRRNGQEGALKKILCITLYLSFCNPQSRLPLDRNCSCLLELHLQVFPAL